MRAVVGCDPGGGGALAVLSIDNELLGIHDMPTAVLAGSRRTICIAALFEIVRAIVNEHQVVGAAIEDVHAMPRRGTVSSFNFGRSVGIAETVLIGCGVGFERVSPGTWKRWAGLTGTRKDASIATAIERWPAASEWLTRKKHHGRADSLLIAGWARARIPVEVTHART